MKEVQRLLPPPRCRLIPRQGNDHAHPCTPYGGRRPAPTNPALPVTEHCRPRPRGDGRRGLWRADLTPRRPGQRRLRGGVHTYGERGRRPSSRSPTCEACPGRRFMATFMRPKQCPASPRKTMAVKL
jgi:hypothetical protein